MEEDFFVTGGSRKNLSGQPADQLVISPAIEMPVFSYQLAFGNEIRKITSVEMQPGIPDMFFRDFFQPESGCGRNVESQGESVENL